MTLFFVFVLISQTSPPTSDRPVIQLDDAFLQGVYKRPSVLELESKELNEKVQALALKNLIELERELLTPSPRPRKK